MLMEFTAQLRTALGIHPLDKKKDIRFIMAQVHDKRSTLNTSSLTGPLGDDGAPYSVIGEEEFKLLYTSLIPSWNGEFEPLPKVTADRPFWQYAAGDHSSSFREILGSVMFTAMTDQWNPVDIRHLTISSSSQWFIGKNFTKHCDIIHTRKTTLFLLETDRLYTSIQNGGMHATSRFTFLLVQTILRTAPLLTVFSAIT